MNIILNILMYIVVAHWTIVSIYTILGIFGYMSYRGTHKDDEYRKTKICIVSKASKGVKDALIDCIHHNCTTFRKYIFNIIIDEESELRLELEAYIKQFPNTKIIIVPSTFKCNAIAKGRAIEYYIRHHTSPDWWYAFIDDDNKILDDKFLKEISYYSKNGYVACNGLLFPRLGRSKLAFVADSVRYFDDLTIFRIGTGIFKLPLNGFHGELLVASGEILRNISFDRETITEDFSFARELIKKGYKTWQSETVISIQSPHSIKDFIKQRNRWYRGISRDVATSNWQMKLFSGIRIIDWKIGIIGSWLIFPVWAMFPIPLWLIIFNFIGASYYYVSYIHGAMRLNEGMAKSMFLIPLYGIMETISPHIIVRNKKEFTVISK